jgi:hypothetical protein
MNIADLSATIKEKHDKETITIETGSRLVNKNQENPLSGRIDCRVSYIFSAGKTVLQFAYEQPQGQPKPRIIIPVVSASGETMRVVSSSVIEIKKENATVRVSSNHALTILSTGNGRIFNYVPGLEAIPLAIDQNNAIVTIEVIS